MSGRIRMSENSKKLKQSLLIYTDPKVLSMLLLGFTCGMPFSLTLSTFTIWLTECGVAKTLISLLILLKIPYSLKFIAAPFIESSKIYWLSDKIGHKRSWALLSQLGLILSTACLSLCDPASNLVATALALFLVVCCMACQDVILYGYQITSLNKNQYGPGAACVMLGYRLGMVTASAGALYIADIYGWQTSYLTIATLMGMGIIFVSISPEPQNALSVEQNQEALAKVGFHKHDKKFSSKISSAVTIPFRLLIATPHWPWLLFFICTFKAGDTLAHTMAGVFYIEYLDFTKTEIASVVKTFGLFATILGGVISGVMVRFVGALPSMLLSGVMHTVGILLFVALYYYGYHNIYLLYVTTAFENTTNGMMISSFIAYLYHLSTPPYSAIMYPFLWGIFSLSRTLVAASSGLLVDSLGWVKFFVLCTLLCLPGLLTLIKIISLQKNLNTKIT